MIKIISDAFGKDRNKMYLLYIVLYLAFCSLSFIQNTAKGDEKEFHIPTAININENLFATIFGEGYLSANTPLPYIIVDSAGQLFGINLIVVRTSTAIISFISLIMFSVLIGANSKKPVYYASLPFLFYPYFLMCSFVFYTPVYGLLFALLAFWFLLNIENRVSQFLFGLSSSFAILSQQFYIVIPAAVIMWRVWLLVKDRRKTSSIKKQIISILLISIPLLLPLWLFVKWKGLLHPMSQCHNISFHIENLTAVFTVLGLVFIPFVISLKKIDKKTIFIFAPVSLILGIFFAPQWGDSQGPGIFPGITFHILHIIENFSPIFSTALNVILVFFGLLLIYSMFDYVENDWEKQLFFIGILLIGVYSFNTILGEKHLLGLVTVLFLLIIPRLKQFTLKAYILGMSVIGTLYFSYWLYLKNTG